MATNAPPARSARRDDPADLSWPLRRAAETFGDADAVVDGERVVSYRQLADRVGALGTALDTMGVGRGERVAFLGVNSLAHLECWLGVPAAGRVLVDLNFRLAERELAFMLDDCGAVVLVVTAEQLEPGRALRRRCSGLRELIFAGPGPCPQDCLDYEALVQLAPADAGSVAGDQLATISYTGGTTGSPKGVMLSHANLVANAQHNLIATGHCSSDRWLHVCPMFHVAGTSNVLACTWVGARQVILPRFDPEAVLEAIARERISHTILVPTMLAMLIASDRFADASLDSLSYLQYAASPISAELQRRVLDAFSCNVAQYYGMTEAAPTVSQLPPEDHRRGFAGEEPYATRLRSIGAPVVGVEAEVRSVDGTRVAAGEVGEIWVRGRNVMLGYWNRPEATESAFSGEWYRSGDAAYADAHGYLYVVDRLKDMIISGGENVYSIEIEGVLATHPAVIEAAVFGIPDPAWGEAVHAVVTVGAESEVGAADLLQHCRSLIAGYKMPRSIDIQTEPLPKSGAGKVLKATLRDPFWREHARQVN